MVSCADGDRLVGELIGGIVGVDVAGLVIGESDGPIVGEDVIGIVTGEFEGGFDGFLVGENVGEVDGSLVGDGVGLDDGEDVGDVVDGALVGDDVIGGGDGLVVVVVSSMNVIGEGDGLIVDSSPTEQTLDVHVILLLNPHPLSQQAPLSSSGTLQSLMPRLTQCASASS